MLSGWRSGQQVIIHLSDPPKETMICTFPLSQASPLIRPPIPPELQKPLRVLGLFDGNGVGLLILEQLGMEVELYVSSEADKDSGHYIKATHVGDIFNLTDKEVCSSRLT